MEKTYRYKHNPIVRSILLAMLAPTILMNLTTAIGSMADTVIIGHYLDDLSLSVVTFATPIYMVINTFAALFAVGGCIAMSIDSGKGEKHTANKAFSMSLELTVLVGIILLLTGIFFSGTVTHWLGAGKDVFVSTQQYSKIVLMGSPLFMLNIALAFFVRNDGRPTLSMAGMFSSIVVDIILNFVFVGYLDMGVSGAAYSTVIGQAVSAVIISSHFISRKNTLKFRFTFGKMIWRIIKNGTSSALHFVYQFLTILIINHFLSKLAGTNGVVIYTVVFNLCTVSLSVFEGISQTIQPMISNYYGEKSYRSIRETLRLAFIAVIIICGTVTLLLEAVPQVVPVIFGLDDASLILDAAVAVRIFAVSMIITTVNVVIGYYLQSTEQNFMAAIIISLRCFVLFLGATLILGKLFGMNGVWAAYAAAEILTFIVIAVMVKLKQKKLSKKGRSVNMLLLDIPVESSIGCYTCKCKDDDAEEYIHILKAQAVKNTEIKKEVFDDALAYLNVLLQMYEKKKGKYIEFEINGAEGKIIIRDNLDHSKITDSLKASVKNGSTSDYGPVLGWNRMCIG